MAQIYLAGPLFTSAERQWNKELAAILETTNHEVWLPQDHEPRELTAKNIFDEDVKGIEWADVVVAVMDGPDPDSGTCWECGYAYARKMPVYLVRTDFRGSGEGNLAPYNLMLSASCTKRAELPFAGVREVASKIVEMLK